MELAEMAGGGVTATFAKRELLKLTLRLSPKKWGQKCAHFLGDIPNRVIPQKIDQKIGQFFGG